MTRPFLSVHPRSLYQTVIDDGATEFVVRLQHSVSFGMLKFDGLDIDVDNEQADSVVKLFKSMFPDTTSLTTFYGHNVAPRAFKEALRGLFEVEELGSSLSREYINFLTLLCNFTQNNKVFTIVDLISKPEKTPRERFQKIVELCGNGTAYIDDKEQMLFEPPIFQVVKREDVPFAVQDMIEKHDNIYYRIEIFGNESYTMYNDRISQIEMLTHCKLTQQLNHREYQAAVQMMHGL